MICHGLTQKLQWGRNFFVTEIWKLQASNLEATQLQWGRNFFVTEMGRAMRCLPERTSRFNGAVTFSLRKFWIPIILTLTTSTSFNGAVTFSLRKCGNGNDADDAEKKLQWGRNFFVTEISLSGWEANR